MKCPNPNCGKEIADQMAYCPHCGTKAEQLKPRDPQDITAIWPEWQKEKELGRGSYGTVYQAVRRDNGVESHSAIKVISVPSSPSELAGLRAEGLDDEGSRTYLKGIVDDFVSEIRLMESVKATQNIVSIEDYKVVEKIGTIGWDIYIRMELLTPFNEYISEQGGLEEQEVIQLGMDICSALEVCSRRNLIHRDIKPENIFVNDLGDFKLGDFGVARKLENVTGGLSQKGTFNYMAPEIATGSTYDATIDTYSLGVVLYRLMNRNRLPFYDVNKQLIGYNEKKTALEKRLRGETMVAPCEASEAMGEVILHACEYEPQNRFSSATAMKKDLEKVKNGTYQKLEGTWRMVPPTPTPTPTPTPPTKPELDSGVEPVSVTPKKSGKNRWVVAVIAAVLVIALSLGVGGYAFVEWWVGGGEDDPSQPNYPAFSTTYLGTPTASSFLNEPKAKIQHTPDRLLDGKMDTAWVEGAEGYGENEYVTIPFTQTCSISKITIWGGYHKSNELYQLNSRPAKVLIVFSDGSQYSADLKDTIAGTEITFKPKVATDSVTIKIVSVNPGSKFKDTVISEVSLF
ncbi:MAG: protein kinase [Clostridia bacterium]|nr:protein kinase [Clostridia bacterium]